MKFPLVLFSLVFLLLILARLIATWRGGTPQGGTSTSWLERLENAYQGTLWTYVLAASVALLLFLLGKPSRPDQWAVWGVLILQVVRILGAFAGQRAVERTLGVVIVLVLGLLWFLQLPMFDPVPR